MSLAWRRVLAAVVLGVVAGAAFLAGAMVQASRTREATCELVDAYRDAFEEEPPVSGRQERIARAWRTLGREYCD